MKVILLKDVAGTGKAHEVVEASEGYARNFLLPKKFAMIATPDNLADIERIKQRHDALLGAQKEDMKKTAAELSKMVFEIESDCGETGKLFGSVTSADIAQLVKSTSGIDVDKKKIVIDDPKKTTGDFKVKAKLFPDVEAVLHLKVVPHKK